MFIEENLHFHDEVVKCTNTHPVVYKCSDIPMACRCVGGRRGPQRKAPGWRKPKMLWSLCQRRWRSPSYPDPHHDLLRSSTRRHSPNGTPRSRWDGSVIVHRSLLFTLWISADSDCVTAWISIWIWISYCCSSHTFLIGIFIFRLSLNQLDFTPSQGRFDALLALLRRQYDRVAVMRPTSQDKVRKICSISLQLSVRPKKTLPLINLDYFDCRHKEVFDIFFFCHRLIWLENESTLLTPWYFD